MEVRDYNSLQFLCKSEICSKGGFYLLLLLLFFMQSYLFLVILVFLVKVILFLSKLCFFISLSLSPTWCYYHCFNHCKYFITVKAIWTASVSFVIGVIKYPSHNPCVIEQLVFFYYHCCCLSAFAPTSITPVPIAIIYGFSLKEARNPYFCVTPKNQALNESTLHFPK